MLKVKIGQLTDEKGVLSITDIIRFCHQKNKFNRSFGISFHNYDGINIAFLETNCSQIMNAVQIKWPNAIIENT